MLVPMVFQIACIVMAILGLIHSIEGIVRKDNTLRLLGLILAFVAVIALKVFSP